MIVAAALAIAGEPAWAQPAVSPATAVERGRAVLAPTWYSSHRMTFANKTHNLALGAYTLEASAVTRDVGDTRLIEELKLTFTPGPAWHKPKLNWLRNPVGLEPDPSKATRFRVELVELRESGRTLAVVRVNEVLERGIVRIPLTAPGLATGTRFEPASWNSTEILLHARFLAPESPAFALPPIADSGRVTWTYRPKAATLAAGRGQAVGRALSPGVLAPIGSGLALFPEQPYAGETFTASIIFQNRGERPTPATVAHWQYDERVLEARIPALAAGRDASLSFQAVAGRTPQPITFRWNEAILSARLEPLLRPLLGLGRLSVEDGYRDAPLVVRLAVGNSGTGEAARPRLFLGAGAADTALVLAPIAPGETRLVVLSLGDMPWPETLVVVARIAADVDPMDTKQLVAIRPARPAPRIRMSGLTFRGEPLPGGAGRAVAVFENVGNLDGFVQATLTVRAVPSGETILREVREERVPAGGTEALVTPLFAWANGITRADLDWSAGTELGGSEFLQAFSAPAPFSAPDGETLLPLASSSQAGSHAGLRGADAGDLDYVLPRRVTETWKFTLPPLENLDELSPSGRLVIASACWLTNPAGTEFLPEAASARREVRPSLKATVTGAGFSDAFTVTAAETQFVFTLPRTALAETLTVALAPAGRSPVYLNAPPHLRLGFATPERGSFSNARVTETGVHLTVANTARWVASRELTVAASYAEPLPNPDGPNRIEATVAVPRGDSRNIFLALPRVPAGRMQLEITLPLSSTPAAQRLEQLVLPHPRPLLDPFRVLAGRTPAGETGILVMLGVSRSPVRDLILAAQEANAAVRLNVPADETAVAWFPGAHSANIDYGPLSARQGAIAAAPASPSSLRLIDCGGDTPAHGQFFLVRFARGGAEARPAGRVYLAVNGLLRAVRAVPATVAGDRWVDGFSIVPGPGPEVEILLFEEGGGGVQVASGLFAVADEPSGTTRVERDWIRAQVVPAAVLAGAAPGTAADSGSSPAERAAQAAWAVASFLAQVDPSSLGELSPEPARSLARLGTDTTAIGRMLYRQQLWALVEQWQASADRLSLGQLPVTLSAARFAAFRGSIQRLRRMAEDVSVINRRSVLEELGQLATHVDHVLGRRIEPALAASLK